MSVINKNNIENESNNEKCKKIMCARVEKLYIYIFRAKSHWEKMAKKDQMQKMMIEIYH